MSSLAAALSTLPSPARAAIAADWALPLYAVGPATAAALRRVVRERMPKCAVRGEEAGRGGELVRVVAEGVEEGEDGVEEKGGIEVEEGEKEKQLERTRRRTRKGRRRVLVLVGEKRRDELRKGLQEVGIGVDEVVVYTTALADGFEEGFQRALGETEQEEEEKEEEEKEEEEKEEEEKEEEEKEEEEGLIRSRVRWVVVFSPQGGREMLKGLGWLDERSGRAEGESRLGTGDKRAGEETQRRTFVASIGPTTAQYLEREFGFGVDVQAARPSPEGVKEGIERFMRERGLRT